jgi:hypothetical protein
MKFINKLSYSLLAAGVVMLSSCSNDLPEFSDGDAFMAFTSSTARVNEAQGTVKIPVSLTSLHGMTASVKVEVVDSTSTAVEGTDFTIANKELSFTPEASTQEITINIVDNNVFTGNKTVVLSLGETSVNLGYDRTCTLTIEDDEHPLLFILGNYAAPMGAYFSGRGPWPDHSITISRDNEDITKVWIENLDPYFAANGFTAASGTNTFYGTVNSERTQISIPCSQEVGYDDVCLYGFDDPDAETDIIEKGNIIIEIKDDGQTLVIPNAFGVCRSSNLSGGWFNIVPGGVIMTKQ